MFDLTIKSRKYFNYRRFHRRRFRLVRTQLRTIRKSRTLKYTMIVAAMDDFKMEIKKLAEVVTQQALDRTNAWTT